MKLHTMVAYSFRGYKIVADCVAVKLSIGQMLQASCSLGEPIKPLCFMSRCYLLAFYSD
jgi:hypothetical protein